MATNAGSGVVGRPGLRAYRVVFANGQVAVRGSLDAARRVVERSSGHDPPPPGILPAEIWEVHPPGETDDHQLLVETCAAAEQSLTGSSERTAAQSLEPPPVAALTPKRAVSKTPAAVGAGVGALAAVAVVRRVLKRIAQPALLRQQKRSDRQAVRSSRVRPAATTGLKTLLTSVMAGWLSAVVVGDRCEAARAIPFPHRF